MKLFKRIMKREYTALCDVCKRNDGFNPKDDDYWICKYGIHPVGDFSIKCKYFKRCTMYHTSKGMPKIYESYGNGIRHTKTEFKRGRFIKTAVNK